MPYLGNVPISGVFYNKKTQEAVATDRKIIAITPTIVTECTILTEKGKVIEGVFPDYRKVIRNIGALPHSDTVQIAPILGKLKAVSNVWDVIFPEKKYTSYIAVYKDIQFQGCVLQKVLQALSDAGNTSAIIHYNDPYSPVRFEAGNMEIWIMPMRPVSRDHKEWTFLDL